MTCPVEAIDSLHVYDQLVSLRRPLSPPLSNGATHEQERGPPASTCGPKDDTDTKS